MNGSILARQFAAKWKARHGKNPAVPFARAGKFFKDRLQDGYDAPTLLSLMDFFLNRFSDSFVSRRGYDFLAFSASFNAVVVAWTEEQKKLKAAAVTNANFNRLEEARGKHGGGQA